MNAGAGFLRLADVQAGRMGKLFAHAVNGKHPSWFVYDEAGTYGSHVDIEQYAAPQARLVVPEVSTPGTIHVVLEVKDDGEPPLYSYRRLILHIQP
jgi:hypothetical protein